MTCCSPTLECAGSLPLNASFCMLKVEAASAREELKSARKDLLQARSEGASLRALYDIANANAPDQSTRAAQQIAALNTQLSEAQASLGEMVTLAELEHARQDIAALEVSWHRAASGPAGSWQTGILRAHLREAKAILQDWCLWQCWSMLTEVLHCLRVATWPLVCFILKHKPQARLEITARVTSGKHVIRGPFACGHTDEPCKPWEA